MVCTSLLHTSPASILDAARKLIQSGPTAIAVAFWGRGAIAELGIEAAHPDTRIILNADSGACNPTELRALYRIAGIKVKNCPRLHAKVVIGGDSLLIGSANFSSNGLGFQGRELTGWHEAGVTLREPTALVNCRQWFNDLWLDQGVEDLSEGIIKRAESAWEASRRLVHQSRVVSASSPVSIEILEGAPIYVVLSDESTGRDARNAFKKEMKKRGLGPEWDFYQGWGKIPKDALLLHYDSERGVAASQYGGGWATSSSHMTVKLPGGYAYPVMKASASIRQKFRAPWKSLIWEAQVDALIRAMQQDKHFLKNLKGRPGVQLTRPTDWCLPLYEFLNACVSLGINVPSPWIRDDAG